jgi:hypothetical protein
MFRPLAMVAMHALAPTSCYERVVEGADGEQPLPEQLVGHARGRQHEEQVCLCGVARAQHNHNDNSDSSNNIPLTITTRKTTITNKQTHARKRN